MASAGGAGAVYMRSVGNRTARDITMEHPLIADRKACNSAFQAHDARFDGRLFVCVSSTGIYCRPVCRVRMPREKNCSFVVSAGAAEAAGFRPCRKCRPELAPGISPVDRVSALARKAALIMENECYHEGPVADLAALVGVSDRHLRRIFASEFGVSVAQHRQTRRLLLAKSLLADTDLPVTQIAFAAGFGSIRRFNALFSKTYRMPPSAMRGKRKADAAAVDDAVTVLLGYRPPYDWQRILAFLGKRTIAGVEQVADGAYRRTVSVSTGLADGGETRRGWIAVENLPGKNVLAVTLAPSLLPALPSVLAKVRSLFDLDCDPAAIGKTLSAMNRINPAFYLPGVRVPGCFDGFEMAVRAILGQQITVKAAHTLAGRLAAQLGTPVETPFAELNRVFPDPATVCRLSEPIEGHFGPLGVIGARARSILALARAVECGDIELSPLADAEETMQRLRLLPGIGPWTAHYIALRALGWPDAFPHTDYGVKKALPGYSEKQILELSGDWRPWRSYATFSLWHSLDVKEKGKT